MTKTSAADFFSRLSKRERMIFIVTATLGTAFAINILVLAPVFTKLNQLDANIKMREKNIKKSLKVLSSEDQIIEERERYQFALSSLSPEEQTTEFLKDVETLAKNASVYLVDIKPAGQTKKGSSQEYLLELNFEGQMDQILSFFYEISHSKKMIKIMRYQIRPKAEGSSIVVCNLAVMGLVVSE